MVVGIISVLIVLIFSETVVGFSSKPSTNVEIEHIISRRRWISSIATTMISSSSILLSQEVANAAPPLSADQADNFSARVERARRPKPAKVLRPRLNLDFAVLLMRSSYGAVDDIDIVSMTQFQQDFFLIRQAEYKPYADALGAGAMTQVNTNDNLVHFFILFISYAHNIFLHLISCREIWQIQITLTLYHLHNTRQYLERLSILQQYLKNSSL